MRELKFRAWDNINKTYIYATLGDLICGACTESGDKKLSGNNQIWEQDTGITDKNGKKIYENDIIRVVNHGDYAVMWNFLQCGFELSPIYTGQDKVRLAASGKHRYEVVSNIHDYYFEEDKITYLTNRQIIKGNTVF